MKPITLEEAKELAISSLKFQLQAERLRRFRYGRQEQLQLPFKWAKDQLPPEARNDHWM